jgi:hypothetical protein
MRSLFLLPLLLAASASAVPIEVTYRDAANTGFFDTTATSPVGSNNGTTLGEQRRIAFEYAASRWAAQIAGNVPVKISAGWSTTAPANGSITLANAGPVNYFRNGSAVTGLPRNNTYYPSALVDQMVGQDMVASGTSDDITVNCNTYLDDVTNDGFVWDYDLNNAGGTGVSFIGTILHELGHGFGFLSGLAANGGYVLGSPMIWDALMTDGAGTFFTTMDASTRDGLRESNNIFADGTFLRLYNGGNPAKVHAPATFVTGSSLHHFDNATYSTTGNVNELMTPSVDFPTQVFGPLVMSAMRDMGYTLEDTQPPTVGISSPVSGKTYTSGALTFAGVFGTTVDTCAAGAANAVGLLRTKIALYSQSQGKWYRWTTPGFDSGTFNHNDHTREVPIENLLPVATGDHTWRTTLPAGLPDGSYELHVASVDQNDQGSDFVSTTFAIDNAAPTLVIEPWIDNAQVFNLDGLRVLAPDAVELEIELRRTVGADLFYWSGTNWSTTPTGLTTTQSGGRWYLTVPAPSRSDWPQGQQIHMRVFATDAADNPSMAEIWLTRTAADTTLPVATVELPASGSTLTVPVLPGLRGEARDLESGVASTSLIFTRFLPGGGLSYWSGGAWVASPVNLPVIADEAAGRWTAPNAWALPSGSSLPNGNYSVEIIVTNRESPAGTSGAGIGFSVDYHPVYTWTGWTMRDEISGNESSSWGVPENWSPYGVPGVEDVAVIANGDQVTSTISRSVYGLKLHNGFLNFVNGPGAQGTVTTSHASEWNGGTLHGIWDVASGASLAMGGSGRQLWAGSQLRNAGTVTWSGGTTTGYENATITNLGGGLWILSAAGDAFNNYYSGNNFINQGTLRHSAVGDIGFDEWTYTLGGEVQKQGGVLIVNAPATIPPGAQFTGTGSFRQEGNTLNVSGTITNATGQFTVAGGTFSATAPVTLSGNYRWSGGAWAGNLNVPSGSDLSILGDCQLNPGSVLNNSGTVHWNSDYPLRGYESVTVNNQAAGVWRLERTGEAFSNYYSGNVFNNAGLVDKTASGETVLANWTYALPGQTKTSAGTLRIAANTSLPAGALLSGAGTFDYSGGTCSLNGEITSTVATLRQSGGTMVCTTGAKIQGNWTWTGGAIAGSLENPVNRQLTINGSCQLNPGTTLDNRGTVVWQAGNPLTGIESVTITNHAGATWEFATAGDAFNNYYSGNQFINQGLLKRSAPTGDVILDEWTYHHAGTFTANAGSTQVHGPLNLMAGGSFTGAGAFSFHSNTTLKGSTTFNANTTVAGGTFTGEAAGLVNGTLKWASSTFQGITKVAAGSFLRLVTTGGKTLGGGATVDVSGELSWDEGDLTGHENSSFLFRSGGLFRIQGGGTMWNYYGNNHVVIEDGGSLLKTNAAENAIVWAFDNDGTTQVNAGLLSLHGGGSGDGVFTGNGGGMVRFANGPHVLEGGASTNGGVEVTGGTLIASGNAGGRIDVKGGITGATPPAVFSFADGSTWTGGHLAGYTAVPNGGSLAVSGPDYKRLEGGTTLTVGGLLLWQGGHPIVGYDSSTISVATGGLFRVAADGDLFGNHYSGNRLLLAGTLEKTAGTQATILDEWLVEGAATLRPQTGSIDFHTTANLLPGTKFEGVAQTRFNSGTATVQGVATIQAGSSVRFAGADILGHTDGSGGISGGTIEWTAGWLGRALTLNSTTTLSGPGGKGIGGGSEIRNTGTMTLGGTGGLTGYDSSTLRNLAGGTLNCPGTCHLGNNYGNNSLINEGTMTIGAPHGRQTLDWRFQQTSTGVLALGVGGENSVTPEFDILQAGGGFQLGGKLTVAKTGGYVPAEETTFTFLNGSGITGTFATVQAPGFGVEYSPASALLRAGNSGLGFEDWAVDHGLTGANAFSDADPDRDGIGNFLEYAFNTDPNVKSAQPVVSSVEAIEGQPWVTLHYRVWQDRVDAGLGYHAERSANLGGWNTAGLVDELDAAAPVVEGSEARRCRVPMTGAKDFLRVRAE